VVDFSTGISPLPPPAEIVRAAAEADLARYPHPSALPFRKAAAEAYGASPDAIVAGAGSVELIWAVARAFAGPGRIGLVVTPAFGEYEQALRASGADVVTVAMTSPGFETSIGDVEKALTARDRLAVVFLCRPSNPYLTAPSADDIATLARAWPRTLFVVDEAYQPLFEDVTPISPAPNVAVLRSLTKLFALPGLRIGYMMAAPAVAAAVQKALPPWNVSVAAQAAGAVAVRLAPSLGPGLRAQVARLRGSLERSLLEVAGSPERSGGPFLLYRRENASTLASRLLSLGVAVRSCASFGLPEHLRVGIRTEGDNAKLLDSWRTAALVSDRL
jgi:histidinol-phosphate/aromatic aminotransferase/cobyric acid decarboxylase-like protein